MKISTKFLSSSIGLGFVIVTLVSSTIFWTKFREERSEQKKTDILAKKEQLSKLNNLLDEQILSLKDYLVLGQNPDSMKHYQNNKSEFLVELYEISLKTKEKTILWRLKARYESLDHIAKSLSNLSPKETQTINTSPNYKQDIISLNFFHRDIKYYITYLQEDTEIELAKTLKKEAKINKILDRLVWILIILIVILMVVQYKLVISPVLASLNELSQGVKRVSNGDFKYRLNLKANNEIAQVAQKFDAMTDMLEELYGNLENKVQERTTQLALINEELKTEMLNREIMESELRLIFNDTRKSEQLLLNIINATPDWIFVKDRNLKFILVNDSFAKHFNKDINEILGKTISELGILKEAADNDLLKSAQIIQTEDEAVLSGQTIHNSSDYVKNLSGQIHVLDTQKIPLIDDNGEITGILGVSRNITERHLAQEALEKSEAELRQNTRELELTLERLQQTQSQIIQSEKMSSLGQMVAGVAHEINNPVNFIFGNLVHAKEYIKDILNLIKLYQEEYPDPSPTILEEIETIELDYLVEDIPRLLNSMTVGAERIREIVKSLRIFSRLDEAEMKEVDIHAGIDSTLMILHNRLKDKHGHSEIHVIKQYGDLPLVECYAGQLNQVFMNILSNAIDALDEYNVGRSPEEYERNPSTITITTEKLASVPGMKEWIAIRIKDNGVGMPEQTQKKLFEPFFTTKAIGKGTGLGLSISHSIIVEKHGGQISCFSEINKGTEFTIEIPLKAS